MSDVSDVFERLRHPDAMLTRPDLARIGHSRRAVDAIFEHCTVYVFPGFSKPMIRVADYLAVRDSAAFRNDRVVLYR